MKWTLVGLGNPGKEYKGSRHNVGRDFLDACGDQLPGKPKIVDLNVYMNNSGQAIRKVFSPKSAQGRTQSKAGGPGAHALGGKAAEHLVVVHDDLDLPLGSIKLSFGSSSGGHRGVESIIRALKTKDFVRVRVGIAPTTPSGKVKKPDSKKVVGFVLGQFKPAEKTKLTKARKVVKEALELILTDGLASAMTATNAR